MDTRLFVAQEDTTDSATRGLARLPRLAEPYDRYKSIDLRTECYHRGTRPVRSGPLANDNKAGYIALLRAYDKSTSLFAPVASEPLLELHVSPTANACVLLSTEGASPDSDTTETTATQRSVRESAQSSDARKKRPLIHATARGDAVGGAEPEHSLIRISESALGMSNGTTRDTGADASEREQKRLKLEYRRLKLHVLRETREMESVRRRDEKRLKLHTELQGVVATIAQLHRLAKEYVLACDSALLADAKEDITLFQARRREIRQELLNTQDDEQEVEHF